MSPTKSITSQVLTDSNNGPASSSDFIDTTTQQNNDASFTPEYGYIKQQPHMPDQGFMMV